MPRLLELVRADVCSWESEMPCEAVYRMYEFDIVAG